MISYGWVTGGGEDNPKRKFYTSSDNGRLLGPTCLVVSIVMFIATAVLRTISTNARFRQTRVGFHCPVHGDFFPISPGPDPRKFSCECLSLRDNDIYIKRCKKKMPNVIGIIIAKTLQKSEFSRNMHNLTTKTIKIRATVRVKKIHQYIIHIIQPIARVI